MIPKEKFDTLATRIVGTRIKIAYDEAAAAIEITIPAGREDRTTILRDSTQIDALLACHLEKITCVGPYAAIASYEQGWVESVIEFGAPFFGPAQMWHKTLFSSNIHEGKEPVPIVLSS